MGGGTSGDGGSPTQGYHVFVISRAVIDIDPACSESFVVEYRERPRNDVASPLLVKGISPIVNLDTAIRDGVPRLVLEDRSNTLGTCRALTTTWRIGTGARRLEGISSSWRPGLAARRGFVRGASGKRGGGPSQVRTRLRSSFPAFRQIWLITGWHSLSAPFSLSPRPCLRVCFPEPRSREVDGDNSESLRRYSQNGGPIRVCVVFPLVIGPYRGLSRRHVREAPTSCSDPVRPLVR